MKRCKSDELPLDEEYGVMAGTDAGLRQQGDAAPSEAACPLLSLPSSSRNSKTQDLKKIQQLSEGGGSGGMFGHGLKQLFHHRKRSRERDQSMQDSSQLHHPYGHSDHDSADEKERSPEMHRVSYAVSLHDLPARPTAFNRVLQQIRARPSIKRGASLHSSSRRTKSGSSEAQKGSPHLARKAPQDSSLTAILQQHQYRPRSSSTTDTSITAGEIIVTHPASEESERNTDKLEKGDASTLGLPANTSYGGSDTNISLEVPDGTPDPHKTKAAIDHLHQKILKITEQIKIEQTARDDNVAEYLKLANNADKQQASRIKQVFEKKNQKSAQTIAQLHKKLEHYHRKLKVEKAQDREVNMQCEGELKCLETRRSHGPRRIEQIEQNGLSRQPKDVLRDMQQGLKDVGANVRAGISGFGGGVVEGVKGGLSGLSQVTHTAVVSKPREFASLIRNKFGSADNIAHLKDTLDESHQEEATRTLSGSATLVSSPKYGSEDECSSATSGSAGGSNSGAGAGGMGSPKSNTLDSHHNNFDTILDELREIKESQSHLEDAMEDLKGQLQRDYAYMTQCLQEERYRYERLEEQLNDLTELHQNEMSNLKQELASMEEKVAYQSDERARDIQEALESCLTRITKLELQQQQQQVVQLEGVENANARALLGKFINVILALMAVILVFVSTIANFITPLMKTRFRVLSTLLLVLFLVSLWKQWENIVYFSEQIWLPS
ncbi:transmembrane and coiled-coil domains protein 2 isoform X1 [Amblyraja radiata]|uniref:transmembrane and coiled-coil domains protein 2 isoform X1 n=1 Tax=Amblyraja radiata TaxID=386614 RepID=UPI001403E23C|nr:transmembrane and coiled-coil domains protein 2 isoform X1 [Amblyraja radiata]